MNIINKSHILSAISCPNCTFEKEVPISKFQNNTTLKCPQKECGSKFLYKKNCIFDSQNYPDISPDAIMHQLDKQAISALRKIPGFDFALRKMMEYGYEKIIRINAMADDVKISPKTCSYIHDMVLQASKCLGVSVPDVYINQNPIPNASTMGIEYPIITIQSGLIELLTEDELYAVISHEMTHIKCHHVLYHMLADFLINASSALGLVGSFIIPLNLALLEWSRKAELSADRGALIITNNKDATIKLLMKLAGGSAQLATMIDENEFVTQAEQFEKMTEGIGLNKVYKIASNITRSHPFPVLRAYEINKWANGEEYKAIFSRDYKRRTVEDKKNEITKCPHCGEKLELNTSICKSCGQNPNSLKNQYDKSGYQAFVGEVKGGVNSVLGFFGSKNDNTKRKVCPKCCAEFIDPNVIFCPTDGTELIEAQGKDTSTA